MCWGRAGALGQGALVSWDSIMNLLLLLHFIRCVVSTVLQPIPGTGLVFEHHYLMRMRILHMCKQETDPCECTVHAWGLRSLLFAAVQRHSGIRCCLAGSGLTALAWALPSWANLFEALCLGKANAALVAKLQRMPCSATLPAGSMVVIGRPDRHHASQQRATGSRLLVSPARLRTQAAAGAGNRAGTREHKQQTGCPHPTSARGRQAHAPDIGPTLQKRKSTERQVRP